MIRLAVFFGTRPEAIKLAPVLLEARGRDDVVATGVNTGQHRDLVRPVFEFFGVEAGADLDIMRPGQGLAGLTARAVTASDAWLARHRPDAIVVQGDTTTAFAAALAAFYQGIPVAHVEAGLRTDNRLAPFPEEFNRRAIAQVADWHFCPTARARDALAREGIGALGGRVLVTGNTGIDALAAARDRLEREPARHPVLDRADAWARGGPDHHTILVTCHRRETFGEPLERLCAGLAELARSRPAVRFVFPVHPNPNVRGPVERLLGGGGGAFDLCEPLDYPIFTALMLRSHLVITDSGGVQEEAPFLGKPVVVTRAVTERPEAVDAGGVELVGTDGDLLCARVGRLLDDPVAYAAMARPRQPYGDGRAARRILDAMAGKRVEEFAAP